MSNAIVPGSLAAVAERDGLSLAQSFLSCEVLVLIDQSGSMGNRDAPGGKSRYEAADAELIRLQREHPGQVAVVSFSRTVEFNPGGMPNRQGAGTDMAAALDFARVADGVCRIVLISDGEPDDETKTLAAARRYAHPIHTIYIGPEHDRTWDGRAFLARLAAATGGRAYQAKAPGLLADNVQQLLLTA